MPSQTAQDILDFWFRPPSNPDYGQPQKAWFIKSAAFDREIRDRFLSLHTQACDGQLDHWQNESMSCLALVIALDQFSRNLYRGTPQAFSADKKALAIANQAIAQGFDQLLLPVQRWFLYLPFEHSEDWTDQQRSLKLWAGLRTHAPSASAIQYAEKHAQVIQQFGRFPHRNTILNRSSTETELSFLKEPGSSF